MGHASRDTNRPAAASRTFRVALVGALALTLSAGGPATAQQSGPAAPGRETVAALDPSLSKVAVPASTSPSRKRRTRRPTAPSSAPTAPPTRCRPRRPAAARSGWLPASTWSSRSRSAANAITVRYSIPDAPPGGGITAPLHVTVNGGARRTMTLTSQFAWLYNQYPFSNDPDAGLLHPDWWITECSCVPAATTPRADDHQAVPAEALLRRAAHPGSAAPIARATRCG